MDQNKTQSIARLHLNNHSHQNSLVADKVIGYIYFTICFVGTISNALMLAVIVTKFLKKKFNPTSIIMIQLCFTDLIGCAIQAPVVCYALIRGRTFSIADDETYAIFCNVFGFLSTLLPLLSIYLTSNLCFIRFIGVHYVFSSKRIMTPDKALILSLVSWIVPILCAAMPFYIHDDNNTYVYEPNAGAFYMLLELVPHPVLTKLAINLIITVPFIVTVVCCVVVVLKLRKNTRQTRQLSVMDSMIDDRPHHSSTSRTHSRTTSKSSPDDCHAESARDKLEYNYKARNSPAPSFKLEYKRQESGASRDKLASRDPRTRAGSRESKRCSELSHSHSQVSHVRDTDSSQRASVTISIITVAFIIAYGPYMLLWMYNLATFDLQLFSPLVSHNSEYWSVYLYIYLISTNVLSTFNSCIFPLIYFIRVKGGLIARFWADLRMRLEALLEKSAQYAEMELQEQSKLQGTFL